MKGIRNVIRTFSGDGLSKSPSKRGGKRGRKKGGVGGGGGKGGPGRPNQSRESQILFCNEMYSVDHVLTSLDDVSTNPEIIKIELEDLIARANPTITKSVQDLFVQTTMSAKIQQETTEDPSTTAGARGSSSTKDFGNFIFGKRSSSGTFSSLRSSKTKSKAKRRVWKKISFVDCVSDSESYREYLGQKKEFVSALTRFLRMQGFQNDLPVVFLCKAELHTLLDALTIRSLLEAIQRDTTVTRLEFGGSLAQVKDRKIPEEFGKLIDPDEGTVKETIVIRLHYDKQSLNMEHDDDNDDQEGNDEYENKRSNPLITSVTAPNGRRIGTKRMSQLDESVLNIIRRMALVLEQKLLPNDLSGDFFEMSDLSGFDASRNSQATVSAFGERRSSQQSAVSATKKANVKLDLFGNPMDDFSESDMSSSIKTNRSDIKPFGNSILDSSGKSSLSGDGGGGGSAQLLLNNSSSSSRHRRGGRHSAVEGSQTNKNKPQMMMRRAYTIDGSKPIPTRTLPTRSASSEDQQKTKVEQSTSPSPPSSPKAKHHHHDHNLNPHHRNVRSLSPGRYRGTSPAGSPKKTFLDKMSVEEKKALLNSVNSVSAPISLDEKDDDDDDASSNPMETKSGTERQMIDDSDTSLRAYMGSDSEASLGRDDDDDSSSSEGKKNKKKKKHHKHHHHHHRHRRSSSDIPNLPKSNAKTETDGNRRELKKALSFNGTYHNSGEASETDPDFDWDSFMTPSR